MNYRTYSVLLVGRSDSTGSVELGPVDQGYQIGRRSLTVGLSVRWYAMKNIHILNISTFRKYPQFQNSKCSEFSTLHYRANSLAQVGLVADGVR